MNANLKGQRVRFAVTLFLVMVCLFRPGMNQAIRGIGSSVSGPPETPAPIQPEAIELLNKVSTVYRNLKQFQLEVEFKSQLKSSLGEKARETQISMAAIRPERMKVILRNSAGQIQYFRNGATSITYLPRLRQYIRRVGEKGAKAAADEDERGGIDFASVGDQIVNQFESISTGIESARIVGQEKLFLDHGRVDCVVVEVRTSKRGGEGETTAQRKYWIDNEHKLVRKVKSQSRFQPEPKADAVIIESQKIFSLFNISDPLGDDIFSFSPPAGTHEVEEFYEPARRTEGFVGKEAPDFTLKTVEGELVQIKNLRGKIVLLNFWASWCGPCRLEMPVIDKLSHQYRDRGLMVFGVNDEDRQTIQDYISENGYGFPTLVDVEQEAASLYNVRAIPTMVVLDREGNVASYRVGLSREAELRAVLKKLGIE